MFRAMAIAALAAVIAAGTSFAPATNAQQVVDRIVARIEGDVLLESDLRELGQFQELNGATPELDSQRLEELIDQWIIEHEAQDANFPEPSDADVAAGVKQIAGDFPSAAAYQQRLKELGLPDAAVKRQVRNEIYLSRYLDYKFRTSVQVDADAEQKYYDNELAPKLKAKGQTPPPIDSIRSQIHELLIQQGITARAAQWLTESRSQIKVETLTLPGLAKKAPAQPNSGHEEGPSKN
jgi:peptidyl-prolyl cis-trans isomerase SurA